MAAQIRPNRLEVNDRFPMLGFTIRTDGTPQRAEVAIATDLALFRPEHKGQRTAANFYSSRAGGALSVPRGEAIYVVPPEVLARFIGAERLYVALATTPERNGTTPHVDVLPGEGSPYISLKGLTGRSLKRVRLLPSRQQRAAGYGTSGTGSLEWAGDNAAPGLQPAAKVAPVSPAVPAAPAPVTGGDQDYDDGFGPMPAPQKSGVPVPNVSAQSFDHVIGQSTATSYSRSSGLEYGEDEDTEGIEGNEEEPLVLTSALKAEVCSDDFCPVNEATTAATDHFTLEEFRCRDGSEVPEKFRGNVQEVMDNLEVLRVELDKPITILSGYRTCSYNIKLEGAASKSRHLCGQAADIKVAEFSPATVYATIERLIGAGRMKQGGLGIYNTFVHYDVRGKKARWDQRTGASQGLDTDAQALATPAKVWARAQEVVAPFYNPADPASALTCQNDVFSQAREEWFVGVPNTRIFPHSAICQLNMVDAAGNGYGGTGFYIGPNRILTCAHNLHGMTSVTIIPGKNSSDEPFGRCTLNASSWRVSNRYPTDGSDYDLAVIDSVPIAAPGGRWFGFLNQTPSDRLPIVVCGYSAQSDAVPELTQAIDGDMQHLHGGYVAQQSNLEVMEYPILTLHGASGSPVYHIRGSGAELRALVCGVHVSGEPAAHGLNRACFITPDKINWIEGRTSALSLGTQSRLPQPPAPLLRRASAPELEAVAPPPFPGAVIERIVGSQGNVRWQLEQLRGVKRPQGLDSGSSTLLAAPTVRLDDWPIVQGSDGAESLPLTVDFEYDGAAVGNVRIVPGLAQSAQGVSLTVTASIKVPPDLLQRPSAIAVLQAIIEYDFTWDDGAVEKAIIELTLFGDGRYERQNRTGSAMQAKAA